MAGQLIRRGDFVTVSMSGDYGKPRPALVVSSDRFSALPSIVVCPVTSDVRGDVDTFRLTIEPSEQNGLLRTSQILIDKISAVSLGRVGGVIGRADDPVLETCNSLLLSYLDLV